MSIIPKGNIPVTIFGPKVLLIYSPPKVGKTSTLLQLPDLLHVDLEGGAAGFYEGRISSLNNFSDIAKFFKEAKETNFHTRFLVLDTVTKLEEYAKDLAALNYRNQPIGKSWNGKDITTLPNGAGYMWLRAAMIEIIDRFKEYCDYLILVGHIKYTNLSTDSEEVLVKELNLTGKMKDIVMANSDAIAFMHPGKETNERYLSFIAEGSTIAGSRVKHLSNERILISKETENGLETYWEKIYPELNG